MLHMSGLANAGRHCCCMSWIDSEKMLRHDWVQLLREAEQLREKITVSAPLKEDITVAQDDLKARQEEAAHHQRQAYRLFTHIWCTSDTGYSAAFGSWQHTKVMSAHESQL